MMKTRDRTLFSIFLVAFVYFVAAKLGLKLAFVVHASATAVWPPAGIALTAFLFLGRRIWPGIFLGAFFANLTTAGSFLTSIGIATGNTLEGMAGAFLVSRWANGTEAFDRPQDLFKFALLAAILSTMVSATIGVTSLSLGGYADWSQYGAIWLTWWLGDAVGDLVIAPVLILWGLNRRTPWKRGQIVEVAFLILFLFLLSQTIFGALFLVGAKNYPLSFLCLPILVWVAFRFSQRETATVIFLLSGIALWATLRGFGPFAREMPNEALLLLQAFMGVASVTALALSAVVSERKKTDEELRRKNEELEKLSQVKDEFVTMVTHELRTPLSAVLEGVKLVMEEVDGPVTDDQRQTLGIVKRNIDRLARMVGNVLDFQRLDSGVGQLNFALTDLKSVVQEISDTVRPEIEKKGLQLVVVVPASRVVASCDSDRIKQVLLNLVDNAMKFTEPDGSITIQLKESSKEVRLVVEDTGVGIKKEDQEKIFKMFGQVTQKGFWKTGGFGVGLAVCKKIIDLHGGRIWVENLEGKGSRFVIAFPVTI